MKNIISKIENNDEISDFEIDILAMNSITSLLSQLKYDYFNPWYTNYGKAQATDKIWRLIDRIMGKEMYLGTATREDFINNAIDMFGYRTDKDVSSSPEIIIHLTEENQTSQTIKNINQIITNSLFKPASEKTGNDSESKRDPTETIDSGKLDAAEQNDDSYAPNKRYTNKVHDTFSDLLKTGKKQSVCYDELKLIYPKINFPDDPGSYLKMYRGRPKDKNKK